MTCHGAVLFDSCLFLSFRKNVNIMFHLLLFSQSPKFTNDMKSSRMA
jgi:hypothetical protein